MTAAAELTLPDSVPGTSHMIASSPSATVAPSTQRGGEPIRADETYTLLQLRERLQLSRTTLFRWLTDHGLSEYAARVGGKWLISGQAYMDWVDSRRGMKSVPRNTSDSHAQCGKNTVPTDTDSSP